MYNDEADWLSLAELIQKTCRSATFWDEQMNSGRLIRDCDYKGNCGFYQFRLSSCERILDEVWANSFALAHDHSGFSRENMLHTLDACRGETVEIVWASGFVPRGRVTREYLLAHARFVSRVEDFDGDPRFTQFIADRSLFCEPSLTSNPIAQNSSNATMLTFQSEAELRQYVQTGARKLALAELRKKSAMARGSNVIARASQCSAIRSADDVS